ncbi:hypothetical protein WICMUC_002750 [Wickerhamomyces mucosus]|uniref:Defective in cullin neddylation protein n=1 Tax=Wickerhamomyces mucosus TaxID=1378264 RepID=A0A9P8PNS9_9ASCO|nr:hypothetical protein WICMUC_002750 [Wickerhamomyces mucosus]
MSRNTKIQKQYLRDRFIDFTSTTASIADQFLKNSNYDLELAINNYYLSSQVSNNVNDNKALNKIFNKYKEPNQDVIGIDGTLQYIEDLGYEPEDKVILALAEFLRAPSIGVFDKNSFILNWQSYWKLLLSDLYGSKIDYWVSFLQKENKATISKDSWNMFYVFLQEFENDPKLETYDDTAAWPSLIDEFVEDYKQNLSQSL